MGNRATAADGEGILNDDARRTGDRATFAAIWLIGDAPKNAVLRQLSQHGGKLVFEVGTESASRVHHVPLLR